MEKEILNKRWKNVDKLLSKYSKDYKKLNSKTQDRLQDVFNLINVAYQDINKPISKQEKARLDRFILELQESGLLSDYFGYKARLILNKKKVTYSEMLEIMVEGCYIRENQELDEINQKLYYEIADNSYVQGIKEAKIPKPIHLHIPFETMYLLLNIPLLNASADAYLKALELNHAEELYKRALMMLQQGKYINIYSKEMQELIKKQQRNIINIRGESQPTGAISNVADNLVNEAYLQVAKDNNIQKVRFVAEMDERTTRMCRNMNGMIFNVQAENKFKRYFGYDAKHLYYKTITCYGLVKGLNMPPIDNHFHWCRSTLTYQLNAFTRENGLYINNYYIDRKGIKHPIEGKEKIEYVSRDSSEYNYALWIKKTLGGKIQLVPKINTEKGNKITANTETPDYIWNGERWDLKELKNVTSKRAVTNAIKEHGEQASCFFIDITNCKLSDKEIIEQVENVYGDGDYRIDWVDNIILTKKGEIIGKYTRK